jgi:hypothetical protein
LATARRADFPFFSSASRLASSRSRPALASCTAFPIAAGSMAQFFTWLMTKDSTALAGTSLTEQLVPAVRVLLMKTSTEQRSRVVETGKMRGAGEGTRPCFTES